MHPPSGHPWLLLDSTLEGVDQGENLVRAALHQSSLPVDDQYWVLLAVRKVLVNAAYHGNHYDTSKKVSLRIVSCANRILIEIGDEGDGFEPQAVPDPKMEQNLQKQSGRGLLIARSFLDDLTIRRREPRGMLIRMTKRLPVQ